MDGLPEGQAFMSRDVRFIEEFFLPYSTHDHKVMLSAWEGDFSVAVHYSCSFESHSSRSSEAGCF
jgi:hypothetical protein